MGLHWGKLLALVMVLAAVGFVTATGAFSAVTADRTATAKVVGDASALLGLEPCNGPNGWNGGSPGSSNGYADIKDGTLVVNLGGYDAGTPEGHGINPNAVTTWNCVFNITNQGRSSATIELDLTGDNPGYVTVWRGDVGDTNITSPNTFHLESGESAMISFKADLMGAGVSRGDSLFDTIDVTASDTGTGSSGEDESSLRVTPNENAEPITIGNGKQTFTIHNDGDESLTVSISLDGSGPNQFQITSGSTSTTIPPGGNHQIRVEAVDASDGSTAVVIFSSDQGTVERSIED